MNGPTKPVLSCDMTINKPLKVIIASEDHSFYLYKGPPFTRISYHKIHKNFVNGIKYSRD